MVIKSELTQRRTVILNAGGREFEFRLFSRPLELGPDFTVEYFWLDASAVRKKSSSDEQLQNFKNCLVYWWRQICEFRLDENPLLIQKYLMANCYFLFAGSRSQQKIYLDAHLRKGEWLRRVSCGVQLPMDDVSADTVTEQLRKLLGGEIPPHPQFRQAVFWLNGILTGGVEQFLNARQQGLQQFLQNVNNIYADRRRRGGDPISRFRLNLLAYASKLAYYECYSNAWIALINRLEAEGLDEKSSLYLRFWHFQNFVSQTDGGLPGGLGGLVLAQHPVSGYLQTDPVLRRACGDFFQQLTDDDVEHGNFRDWESYGKFLSAIVLAANQFSQQHQDDREFEC